MNQHDIEKLNSRKPARRMAEIPGPVKKALEEGRVESKNLVEWLSVHRLNLLRNIARDLGFDCDLNGLAYEFGKKEKFSALEQSRMVARCLNQTIQLGDPVFHRLSTHSSEVVREWMAFVVGLKESVSFQKKLAWIKPFADDPNPGLREVAWFALRNQVIAELDTAITKLVPWTGSRSERLRRYASEITRPCGVWAAHIPALKAQPELALPLLEPLKADDSKYVRDSVANWLNDASKSQPAWVRSVTKRWLKESPCQETAAIVKRGLRTLDEL